MANTQKLSPQGYNIQQTPTNSNPFWDNGGGGGGGDITVDDELSLTSTNPVENRIITAALIETQESIPDVSGLDNRLTTAEGTISTQGAEISRISGDLTEDEQDIASLQTAQETASNRLTALETGKQDKLTAGANITIVGNVISSTGGGGGYTFDTTPTQGSTNPVTSGGIYNALRDAEDTAINAAKDYTDSVGATKQNVLTFDTTPVYGSTNPVTSSGVRGADVYHLQLAKEYTDQEIDALAETKQDKLTAGTGISISASNVISATGGGGGGISWQSLGTFSCYGDMTVSTDNHSIDISNIAALKTPGLHIITIRPVSVGEYTVPDNLAPVHHIMYYVPSTMQNIFTTASHLYTASALQKFILTTENTASIGINMARCELQKTGATWTVIIQAGYIETPAAIDNNTLYCEIGHIAL